MLRRASLFFLVLLLATPPAVATHGAPHLRGVVRDPDGAPVERFWISADIGMEAGVTPVYTDATGAYDLPLRRAGCWVVEGDTPLGPVPREPHLWLDRAPCVDVPVEGATLDLSPRFRPLVRGFVTTPSGSPIAGRPVVFESAYTASVFTNATGAYLVALHLPEGAWPRLVSARVVDPTADGPHWAPACTAPSASCIELPERGTTWLNFTVNVTPVVDVVLRARHADGTPAPGLQLTLRDEAAGRSASLTTGPDGVARGTAAPGDYVVSAYRTVGLGYVQFPVCADAPCVHLPADASDAIDLVVPRIHRVWGVVRDAGGPDASAALTVWGRDRWSAEATVDAQGRYEVAVPEGEYEVWLDRVEGFRPFRDTRCAAYRPLCGYADARAGDARVDLDVPPLGTFVARVVDAQGEPVERVDVTLGSGRFLATAKSDAQGEVRLRAPVGTYSLWTRPPLSLPPVLAPTRCDACVTLATGATAERVSEHLPGALVQGKSQALPWLGGDKTLIAAFLPDEGGAPVVASTVLNDFDLVLPPGKGTVVVVGPTRGNETWGAWIPLDLKPGDHQGLQVNLTPLDVLARANVSGIQAIHARSPGNGSIAVVWSTPALGEPVLTQGGAVLRHAIDPGVLGPTVALARVEDAPWDAQAWAGGEVALHLEPPGVAAPPQTMEPARPTATTPAAREASAPPLAWVALGLALAALARRR